MSYPLAKIWNISEKMVFWNFWNKSYVQAGAVLAVVQKSSTFWETKGNISNFPDHLFLKKVSVDEISEILWKNGLKLKSLKESFFATAFMCAVGTIKGVHFLFLQGWKLGKIYILMGQKMALAPVFRIAKICWNSSLRYTVIVVKNLF